MVAVQNPAKRLIGPGLWLMVAGLFAASGVASLAEQVVWNRWLTLALGSSSHAATVVLASFMGGLGLGSWIGGKAAKLSRDAGLRLYAIAEIAVGLWALFSIVLLRTVLPQSAAALARASDSATLPFHWRVGLSVLGLAIPTLLMGATVPFIAQWAARVGFRPGRDIGWLYALNTLGGAAGALIATFWWISHWGLTRTVVVAAAINIAVGVVAWILARRPVREVSKSMRAQHAPRISETKNAFPVAVLAFALSGAIGLALEVVVHRVLAVLAGSSVYAFSVMLAAFLIGIAAGSAFAAMLADRMRDPPAWIGVGLGALALGIGSASWLFAGDGWRDASRLGKRLPFLADQAYGGELGALLLILLPATIALGFIAPCVARLAASENEAVARRFGMAYAANTLGAVAGATLAGFFLIPRIGTAGTLAGLALLAGLGGIAVILLGSAPAARKLPLGSVVVGTVLGTALAGMVDPVRTQMLRPFPEDSLLVFREGPVQTIALLEEGNDQQLDFLRLVTNRTSLTGTHLYAMRYMRLLGHLPALYGTSPQRALVISFGTGMTAGALTTYPEVERLDIAEISPAVVDIADRFAEVNENVLHDPRTRMLVDDGRHVLASAAEPWDLITLEPPPPRDSGVVSLYTRDFYDLCRKQLVQGGVLAQWIPLHSQSGDEIKMLIRSLLDAFPHVLGFLPVERDLLLLASDEPLVYDEKTWNERLDADAVRRSLRRIGIDGPAAIVATALLDREGLSQYAGALPAVTDDQPVVEYFLRFGKKPPLPKIEALLAEPPALESLAPGLRDPSFETRFATARQALLASIRAAWAFEQGDGEEGRKRAMKAFQLRPRDEYVLWINQLSDEHLARLERSAERTPTDPAPLRTLGYRLLLRARYAEAVGAYDRALSRAENDPATLLEFGNLLLGPGNDFGRGQALLMRLIERHPRHPAAAQARAILSRRGPRTRGMSR